MSLRAEGAGVAVGAARAPRYPRHPMSESKTEPEVVLRVARVILRERAPQQWVFLEEAVPRPGARARGFPIVIGSGEAFEIHRVLVGEDTPRPLTHQLVNQVVHALGSRVLGVDIVDLRKNTFYARLRLAAPGADGGLSGTEEVLVDARPSDALAIALRVGATIRVSEALLEEVRTDGAQDPLEEDDEDDEQDDEPPMLDL